MVKGKEHSELSEFLKDMSKKYGDSAYVELDEREIHPLERVPFGVLSLDTIIGGGVPKGRILEIYGAEQTGKSSLCYQLVKNIQALKLGLRVAYIDMEQACNPSYLSDLGISTDKDKFLLFQPSCGEESFDIAESLLKQDLAQVIIVDSVAALIPRAELEGEFGESKMGLQARLMSQAMRKVAPLVNKTNAILIFINQLRSTMGGSLYGPSETTTGGQALKYYASIRLEVKKGTSEKAGEAIVGVGVKIRVTKNKTFPPYKTSELLLMFGEGFVPEHDILIQAVEQGIVVKAGSWFSYEGNKIAQGQSSAVARLCADKELKNKILNDLIKKKNEQSD